MPTKNKTSPADRAARAAYFAAYDKAYAGRTTSDIKTYEESFKNGKMSPASTVALEAYYASYYASTPKDRKVSTVVFDALSPERKMSRGPESELNAFNALNPHRKMASIAAFYAVDAECCVYINTEEIKTAQKSLKSLNEIDNSKVVKSSGADKEEEALRLYAKLLANQEIKKLLLDKQVAHKEYLIHSEKFLKSFQSELDIKFSKDSSPTPEDKERFQKAIKECCYDDLFVDSYYHKAPKDPNAPKDPTPTEHWFVYDPTGCNPLNPMGCTPLNKKAKNTQKELTEDLESAEKAIKQAQKEFEGIKDESGKNYKDNGIIGSDIKTLKAALDKLNELKTKKTASPDPKATKLPQPDKSASLNEEGLSSIEALQQKYYASLDPTATKLPQPDKSASLNKEGLSSIESLRLRNPSPDPKATKLPQPDKQGASLNRTHSDDPVIVEVVPEQAREDVKEVIEILKETSSLYPSPTGSAIPLKPARPEPTPKGNNTR